jgi:hypothetical protein
MTITPYFCLTKTGFCKTPMISSGQTSYVMCHIQVRAMLLEVPYRIIIYIYTHSIYIHLHMAYADLIQLLILETNFRIPTVPTCSNTSGHGSWGTACSCCIDSTSQVGVPWLVHGEARDAGVSKHRLDPVRDEKAWRTWNSSWNSCGKPTIQ